MAITFVAASSGSSKDITTQAVPEPANIQVDDVLFVHLATNGGSGVEVTPPAGWTLLDRTVDTDAGANETAYVYRKVATTTEVGAGTFNFEFTFSSNRQSAFGCIALRGVDTTTPEDQTTVATTGDSNTPDPGSITTQTDGAWVLAFMAQEADDNITGLLPPTGYTEAWEDFSTGDTNSEHTQGSCAYKEIASAGAEDPGAFTAVTTDGWVCHTVAVKPAAGGGGGGAYSFSSAKCSFVGSLMKSGG